MAIVIEAIEIEAIAIEAVAIGAIAIEAIAIEAVAIAMKRSGCAVAFFCRLYDFELTNAKSKASDRNSGAQDPEIWRESWSK